MRDRPHTLNCVARDGLAGLSEGYALVGHLGSQLNRRVADARRSADRLDVAFDDSAAGTTAGDRL